MSIDTLKGKLPEYAKDIKLNLSSLVSDESLTEQQLWGSFFVAALASRSAEVIREIEAEASEHLSPEALNGAKAAHAIMAMNNVYYKTTGILGGDYLAMPAKLRMNILANPGVEKLDFELWSTVVSAINGCTFCVKSHEKKIVSEGMSSTQIQTAIRIGSVVQAVAAILDGEAALSGEMSEAA